MQGRFQRNVHQVKNGYGVQKVQNRMTCTVLGH